MHESDETLDEYSVGVSEDEVGDGENDCNDGTVDEDRAAGLLVLRHNMIQKDTKGTVITYVIVLSPFLYVVRSCVFKK